MSEPPPAHLRPQDVADILGLGVSTVKRMVDSGQLPARLTAGRHRRIDPGDVARLVHSGNYPCAKPELLAALTRQSRSVEGLSSQLEEALLAGDAPRVRALLGDGHDGGLTIGRLGDEVIAPVMARIGHGWEVSRLDVYQEHRATQTCLGGLLALRAKVERRGEGPRPMAVGGGIEGDHYALANALIELLFLEIGWEPLNVGPNTPFDSFARVLRQVRPKLLWLSASFLPDEKDFRAGLARLYLEARRLGVKVAVGGNALPDAPGAPLPSDYRGRSLAGLAEYARSLA